MIKILLDAGHYEGYNPSKAYPQYKEGNKMFTLVNYVKEYLENKYVVKIDTTRANNKLDKPVYDRGYMSKGYNAFYSFHSNACDSPNVERVIIFRAFGNTTLNSYALELANGIKDCIGIKQASQVTEKGTLTNNEYYGVLRGAKNAGTKERYLIEHGFHTNEGVAKWLNNDDNLKKLAKVEAEIIAKHHGLKPKANVKMIKIIKDVNYRSKPIFNDDKYIVGKAKVGEVFTVMETVNSDTSTKMYKLKSGNYITSSSKYVEIYK